MILCYTALMKWTYTVEGVGKVTITDKDFLGAGGEAQIFVKDNIAYKIYHDKKFVIPADKIKELLAIKATNVLKPEHMVYDPAGVPVGYCMTYKPDTHAICKLFTKAFKTRSSVTNEMITKLVEEIQNTIGQQIHPAKCLVVDLNELNLLSSADFKTPFFIDVDSFQTPSYRATAIMESIRDHKVKANHWTEESDWYSFGILAIQLWLGIHPYKGSHPDYKANEWVKRMEDGVSIFDSKSAIPSICSDFSVIPPSHLAWFKDIFLNNNRSKPPKVGDLQVVVSIPTSFRIITSSDMFTINRVEDCIETIINVFNYLGINYIIGTKNIHKGKATLPVEIAGYSKVLMCESENAPVVCKLKDDTMFVEDDKGNQVGSIAATDMMYRNGCIYTARNGRLTENSFVQMGTRVIHAQRLAANILDLSTKVFDGVIFQDLLGKIHVTLPFAKGKCITLPVNELNGFRILDARCERNICGVMAEKSGIYYSFVLTFNDNYSGYTVRVTKDVSYGEVNLTVLPNGVAIMANNTSCEIFMGNSVKVIDSPPFNSTTKLFNYSGGVHYIDGKTIMSAKSKK